MKGDDNMKRIKSPAIKTFLVILSAALIMAGVLGATFALLIDRTDTVANVFTSGEVKCSVVETFTDGGLTKSNVMVANGGNTDAYIRCAIVFNWKNESGNVYPAIPQEDTDYEIIYTDSENWFLGDDGFWYFKNSIAPGENTEVLIKSCSVISDGPDGYNLSVDILASAIQSNPADAVTQAWGVTVTDGALTDN